MNAKTNTRNTRSNLSKAAAADVERLKAKVTPVAAAVQNVVDESGAISEAVTTRIAQRMFLMPLPPEHSDLPTKLETLVDAFGKVDQSVLIEEGVIAKGRDYELACILPKALKAAYNRLAYLKGSEDLEDAAKDTNAAMASGMAYFKDEASTFDPEQDGLGFKLEGAYMPETVEEAVYDIECILRVLQSLSKHEGLSYLLRAFIGSNGEKVEMMPSYAAHCKAAKKRQNDVNLAMAKAEKDGTLYTGWTGYGERTLDGFECTDIEFHPMSIGINEALVEVERILSSEGWTQEIGKELVDRSGKSKAIALVNALYEGNWRKVKSATRYFGLMQGSAEGQMIISNLVLSPEWEAEQAEAEDRKDRRVQAKQDREDRKHDRETRIQRDRDIREMQQMKDDAIRMKARLEHEKLMKAMQADINAIIKPKAEAKPKTPRKTTRKSKTK